ncbi:DHA1 family inner membrane transport protein [Dongia mobilis]|uniref:DHA1 family inner membrane transport protein n=2 Tax=Dongia mobilis TaxID=578943 RepID=A0A4R6WMY6_9PROT|nr:DHA1 family inner membrane transport protein [Dongia mobilis]
MNQPSTQMPPTRMPVAILALAAGCFGIGTTEFVVMGLLPDVAGDLGVTIPQAGLLVTAYAVGVVIGAPLMAMATARLPRKGALLGLMGVFILGNLACAAAPTYGLMMAARIFTAFAHAAFMGIGAVVAADLAPPNKRAQAMALTLTGLTIANVLGVPGGTAFGHWAGWRMTFVGVAGIGAVAGLAVLLLVPKMPALKVQSMAREFAVLKRPQVLLGMAMSAMSAASLFSVYTYITPLLASNAGMAAAAITAALVLFGVGFTLGGLIGGRLADWHQMRAMQGGFVVVALLLVLFTVSSGHMVTAIATMILWGIASFAVVAPLQMRVIDKAHGAPNLASTINHAGFNIGCASGAFLGGIPLSLGADYTTVPWVGAGIALLAFVTALLAERSDRAAPLPAAAE